MRRSIIPIIVALLASALVSLPFLPAQESILPTPISGIGGVFLRVHIQNDTSMALSEVELQNKIEAYISENSDLVIYHGGECFGNSPPDLVISTAIYKHKDKYFFIVRLQVVDSVELSYRLSGFQFRTAIWDVVQVRAGDQNGLMIILTEMLDNFLQQRLP